MTRTFAKLGGAPAADTRELTAWMNYPYRNAWADIFSGLPKKLTRGYWPTCPLLFIYGKDKPFHFHSERWVEHVKKVGGEVVALPANHWVMQDPSFVAVLVRWLESSRTGRTH